MAILLKHQTAQDFIARFREAYRNADRERLVQLAEAEFEALVGAA